MRITITACVMLVIASAEADTPPERAGRLFDEGLALKDKGDPRACDKFAESYRLVAAAGTGYNLAECMEQQGQLLRAWKLYSDAILEWQKDRRTASAAKARDRMRALEGKLVTVLVELTDPKIEQLSVTIATRNVKPSRTIRELADPGAIEIRAVAPGYVPFVRTVEAEAGATTKLQIALQPIEQIDAPAPLVETHRRRSRVALSIGMAGLGVAGAVAGTVLFLDAREQQAAGNTSVAQHRADLATGFGAGGIVFLVAATVVFVTAPRDVSVTPLASATTAGVSLSGSF